MRANKKNTNELSSENTFFSYGMLQVLHIFFVWHAPGVSNPTRMYQVAVPKAKTALVRFRRGGVNGQLLRLVFS